MAKPDITRRLLNDLHASYNGAVGAKPDLTTWLSRKLGVTRAAEATTTAPLLDGDGDVDDELRTYLNGLGDTTTP
jgi:hypothetical protein